MPQRLVTGEDNHRVHGAARDVLDYIEWMWHVEYVRGICDSLDTAMAVFNSFQRSASAERGRAVFGV